MTTNIRPLTRISPAQIIAGGGQQDSDYVLDRPPFTRYVWNGSDFAMIGAPDATHTAAELTALAAAGGLTPYATYVASDTGVWYRATDASTLVVQTSTTDFGEADPIISSTYASSVSGSKNAPAFVRSIGASNAVAAAMEAFSTAMPKNGRYTNPQVSEQGVIRLDARQYTLEKPLVIDVSGASVSRYGLTIEGTGQAGTVLYVPANASSAVFRDPFGDGIWRAMQIKADASDKISGLTLRNFRVVSYVAGDGVSTPLTDPCRWIDLRNATLGEIDSVECYMRRPSALSRDQYAFSIFNSYYFTLRKTTANMFFVTSNTAPDATGALFARRGGVGYRLENNNALTAVDVKALGTNLCFHLVDEDGISFYGGSVEDHNKVFLVDGGSAQNRVVAMRAEWKVTGIPVEADQEVYGAMFTEGTRNNKIELMTGGVPYPANLRLDYSLFQSNSVDAPGITRRKSAVNLLAGASWTNGPGITSAAGADSPTKLDPSIVASVDVTSDGGYNKQRYIAAGITVNPDWGSLTFRVMQKRRSGMGLMDAHVASQASASSALYGSRAQFGTVWPSTIPMAASGHSFGGGKLTMVAARAHGLQPGVEVQSGTSWGTMTLNTKLYVESMPSPTSLVLVAAAGGSISDPGAISSPGAMTVASTVTTWQFVKNISADWQEFVVNFPFRMMTTALALDGGNKPVLTLSASFSLTLATGMVVGLRGFADSRLNIDYTIQSGDVSGSNLTLSALAAMPDLVMTDVRKNLTGSAFFGWCGLTKVYPQWRTTTLNTGVAIVHGTAGEALYPGVVDV